MTRRAKEYPATVGALWVVVGAALAVLSPPAALGYILATLLVALVYAVGSLIADEWRRKGSDRDA